MCASATQFTTLFQLIVLLESHQERANNYLVCTNDIVHSFQNKLRSSTHRDRGYTHGTYQIKNNNNNKTWKCM